MGFIEDIRSANAQLSTPPGERWASPAAKAILGMMRGQLPPPIAPPSGPGLPYSHRERETRPAPDGGERFEVTTPDDNFAGVRAGVKFSGGVGYTSDEKQAADCLRLGYAVNDRAREQAAERARASRVPPPPVPPPTAPMGRPAHWTATAQARPDVGPNASEVGT